MSLINQALKLEQQKRQTQTPHQTPLVGRMAQRGNSNKLPMLLLGFTGMGMLLAASVTAIFYFGSGYLESEKSLAVGMPPQDGTQIISTSTNQVGNTANTLTQSGEIASILGTLSPDQLSTVQKMLLEREAASPSTTETEPEASEPANAIERSEVSRIQDLVDSFSVQGIRKAGSDTRVFLNGKIRRIGDIVDIENGLKLVGFTETNLVFKSRSGITFQKSL